VGLFRRWWTACAKQGSPRNEQPEAGADEERTLARLRGLRSDLIDPAIAAHHGRIVNSYLVETSVPGVFACGDVRFSPVKRVASAVGEGGIAIAFVHQYLAPSSS
jgi:hypothetical protein